MTSSSPLRILHLVAIRGKGGTGASTLALVEGLADRGHRVAVVCFKRGLLYQSLKDKGKVELVTGIKMAPGLRVHHWIRDLVKLKPFLERFRPQVIHTHSSPDYWLGLLVSTITGSPLVRSRHVPVPLNPHALNRWLYHRTAAVVAVSHAVGDRYFSGINWAPEKVRVICDGVDTLRFNTERDGRKVRKELGLSGESVLVGSIARYSKIKGLPYFLDALGQLMDRDSRVRGLVVGRIKNRDLYLEMKKWLSEKGLEGKVTLEEHRNDAEDVIAALDVAVLASLGSEGSSRVALEAGASGKPLVATSVGALPEVVADGKTGYLVPPGDAGHMARGIGALLPPLERKKKGLNARIRIHRCFDVGRSVVRIEALYREIVRDE